MTHTDCTQTGSQCCAANAATQDSAGTPELSVRPQYELADSGSEWTLTAHLPGVAKTGLSITDTEGTLTIRGGRAWKQPDGWAALHRETDDAPYALSFEHNGQIDAGKIRAEFADGVLKLTLPRAEALKPRTIAVN